MTSNNIKEGKNDIEESHDSVRAKIDPDFAKVMYECYKEQEVKIRPELNEKLMEIARAHKRKLDVEGKVNDNGKWLGWARPIIISMGTLFLIIGVIGGLSYLVYQYQLRKGTSPGLSSNKHSPTINTNPSPVPTPEATPITIPNIAKENNDKKINPNIENQNDQNNNIAKDQKRVNKQDKVLQNDDGANSNNELEEIALNELLTNIGIEEISKVRGSSSIRIFVDVLVEEDLREELKKLLQGVKQFELIPDDDFQRKPDIVFQWAFSEPNLMILKSDTRPIVWKKKVDSGTPKQQAQNIVSSLIQSIEKAENKKSKKN